MGNFFMLTVCVFGGLIALKMGLNHLERRRLVGQFTRDNNYDADDLAELHSTIDVMQNPSGMSMGKKIAIVAAALLYFLSPIDIIPDPLIGPGQADDIAVIWWAWHSITKKAITRK